MASRYTNFPNGVKGFPRDSRATINTDGTLTVAVGDGGKTFICQSATTVTLPAISAVDGNIVTIVNDNPDGTLLIINPNAIDYIKWENVLTDAKPLENVAATSKRNDYVTLGAHDTTGWTVLDVSGVWTINPA